jgi:hypothetical protein
MKWDFCHLPFGTGNVYDGNHDWKHPNLQVSRVNEN